MNEAAEGIVLRTFPLTETSLVVHWLTSNLGRIATVAKGARRPKSSFHGKLDIFYFAEFSFYRSRRSELHTLKEVALRESHTALRRELWYLQQAAYCAALIERTTETETPLPQVFTLFKGMLDVLGSAPPSNRTVLAFELKLLEELGLGPDLANTRLTRGAQIVGQELANAEWHDVARSRLEAAHAAELKQFLHGFLIYQLGRLPRGRETALSPD